MDNPLTSLGAFEGISLGPNCPSIHSLLFADDLLVCGQASLQEARTMAHLINHFCSISGQTPNWAKSAILFSSHVPQAMMQDIKQIFPVSNLDSNFTHLGHALVLPAKRRATAYNFVLDKFLNKLPIYKANMLSHAARLELIRSVFLAIPVYYMANILFTKKFIAKLTAVIRNFWWTGVRENDSKKSLCLRAWKDICNSKDEGGLGVRNLKAINESLLISAAWRLAKFPCSHLHLVLKAKYFHDASIWTATAISPKSAFWASILKLLPKLKAHSFYQLSEGNISIWSTPWCTLWSSVHDHLIAQQPGFIYPSLVKDLWLPGQKSWNHDLVFSLFQQPLASLIVQTEIIDDESPDLLCWDLTPNGICSSKSAYKLCLQEIHANPRNAPATLPLDLLDFLKLIWKQKDLLPRVKTFAWRLLRKALPTGLRAGRFSIHISKNCCRCGQQEDEFHLFFLCNFSRAAWFSSPWFLQSDALIQGHSTMHSVLFDLLRMGHPHDSISSVLNFLWCLWKARNDFLFDRKKALPHQVHIAALALASDCYDNLPCLPSKQDQAHNQLPPNQLPMQGRTLKTDLLIVGPKIYSDAAYRTKKVPGLLQGEVAIDVGVYISMPFNQKEINVQVQASTSPTSTPLQAEALALSFAAHLASQLNIAQPTFLLDCLALALAVASGNICDSATPWNIRKSLASFFKCTSNLQAHVFHISREINGIAHNLAQQVFRSDGHTQLSCFAATHSQVSCPVLPLLSNFQIQGFRIHTIHCY
ncbi:hypothetical protein VPH35_082361 [Triticum aestivum]